MPDIIVSWRPDTARYKPSHQHPDDRGWESTFWRSTVAGVRFQVGNIPYTIMSMSPARRDTPPDAHPDSCWQIWFAEEPYDWPEYMAVLRGATEAHQALDVAQRYITGYFAQKRDTLLHQLDELRRAPLKQHPDSFHDPRDLRVWDLERRIERIDHEAGVGQARLF